LKKNLLKVTLQKLFISFVALILTFCLPVQVLATPQAEFFTTPPAIRDIELRAEENNFSTCFVSNELLVKFKAGTGQKEIDQLNEKFGAKIVEKIPSIEVYRLKITNNALPALIEKYNENPIVEFAEPNSIHKKCVVPNDPLYSNQWALPKIQAESAWDVETGSTTPMTIAILDTGIDASHPEFSGKIVAGYDFVNNDSYPSDDNAVSHGTAVASIAAALTNNGAGIAGLSWGAKIMPVKVLDSNGEGNSTNVIGGIMYAANKGANVINLSLGSPTPSSSIEQAINYARDKGCVIVAAAGNYLENKPFPYTCYPAAYDGVIAVSATNESDGHPDWSNSGPFVDVSAPGSNIFVATMVVSNPSMPYSSSYYGTSAAAPYVSALAALILSKYPTLTPAEVENMIIQGVDDLGSSGYDNYFGYGRINALKVFKVERIYGSMRYLTAVNISKKGWATSPTVVIATGESFPDALAGAALAGKYNCPILLTPKTSAPTEVLNEISRLGATTAYILGGAGAISDTVVSQLKSRGLSVTIRLSGSDRYETASAIAKEVGASGTAIIATGENFPDALAASSMAASQNIPILLVSKNSIPEATNQALLDLGITQTIIVGGFAVISSEAEANLPGPTRLSGADRYKTAAEIVKYAQANYGLSWTKPVIATGENFPDALGGGAFACKSGSPLLITSSGSLPETINSILSTNAYSSEKVYVLGGTGAVSNTVVTQIASIIQ